MVKRTGLVFLYKTDTDTHFQCPACGQRGSVANDMLARVRADNPHVRISCTNCPSKFEPAPEDAEETIILDMALNPPTDAPADLMSSDMANISDTDDAGDADTDATDTEATGTQETDAASTASALPDWLNRGSGKAAPKSEAPKSESAPAAARTADADDGTLRAADPLADNIADKIAALAADETPEVSEISDNPEDPNAAEDMNVPVPDTNAMTGESDAEIAAALAAMTPDGPAHVEGDANTEDDAGDDVEDDATTQKSVQAETAKSPLPTLGIDAMFDDPDADENTNDEIEAVADGDPQPDDHDAFTDIMSESLTDTLSDDVPDIVPDTTADDGYTPDDRYQPTGPDMRPPFDLLHAIQMILLTIVALLFAFSGFILLSYSW